jgi:Domain of unknown function (DUF4336)
MALLQSIAKDLWMVDGPSVSFFGIPYPTRMVLIGLPEGLWVWSPIALDEALVDEILKIGPVKWLVEPNKLHHLFLPQWLRRFPEARAFAPPGLSKKKPEISFAGELGDAPEPDWAPWIDQLVVRGSFFMEEVLFLHRPSRTCIVGDLVQRQEPELFTRRQRWLMNADALLGERGSTPRDWRATFIDRKPGRRALQKMMEWKPERLLIAHGSCVMKDGSAVLEEALAWIHRPWPV